MRRRPGEDPDADPSTTATDRPAAAAVSRPRVCVIAEYYPRRRDAVLGVWAHRQALAAREAGASVRVLALDRPLPSAAALRGAARGRPGALLRELRGIVTQPGRDSLDGLDVRYLRFLSPPRERSYARWERWARRPLERALERVAREQAIDVVHAHYALPAGGAAQRFAERHGIPLVVSVHGGDVLGPAVAGAEARARIGEVLRASALVLCNSRATLERAAALAGSGERMRVVHLGADPPPGQIVRRAQPTVATLGHVISRKRHGDVLRAIALAAERLPELRWVVIGDGPALPALRAEAPGLGVADRVEWLGQLPPDAALAELARCHLMALPSRDEAFGVAYAEALACGLPAIGCRGEGGPEEIAALGEGMVLVPPEDAAALADVIAELLTDDQRRSTLADAARATAAQHLSWARCGAATVAAYRDALAGGVA